MQKLYLAVFEDNRFIRATARFVGLFGAVVGIATFVYQIREWFSPLILHIIVSGFSLIVCASCLIQIYNKIYGKLARESRIFRHPFLTYNAALVRAIRLSSIDDSYFIAVTWLKMSRVLVCSGTIAILFTLFEKDNHSHKMSFILLERTIFIHELLDAIVLSAILSAGFFALWQIVEINLISRGTAKLVNKRKNAKVRGRINKLS